MTILLIIVINKLGYKYQVYQSEINTPYDMILILYKITALYRYVNKMVNHICKLK